MNDNGTILHQQTLIYLNVGDINIDTDKWKRKDFDAKIQLKLGDSFYPPNELIEGQETYADNTKVEEPAMTGDNNLEWYDEYISSEVILAQDGEQMESYKVISYTKDHIGDLIGVINSNPILDNRVYNVMLPYGPLHHYEANIIFDNMYL